MSVVSGQLQVCLFSDGQQYVGRLSLIYYLPYITGFRLLTTDNRRLSTDI